MPKDASASPLTTTERGSVPERALYPGRLKTPREFRAVYNGGQRRVSRSFVVFILPTEPGVTRVGLTTPRKLGKAHERNRIRRRIREIVRQSDLELGADVVINPRRSVLARDFQLLARELRSLLEMPW